MRNQARAERLQRHFEIPVLVASLLTIPALLMIDSGSGGVRTAGIVLNWVSWAVFACELVVLLMVTPRPVLWARRHPLRILIVLGSLPLFPAPLAWLRLFRLFRVMELAEILPGIRGSLRGDGVRYPALLGLFVVVLGGLGLTVVEPDQDLSAADGLWWSVETVTTVGYGDIVPATDAGRLLGALVMLTGIGIVGYVMAHAAEQLTQGDAPGADAASDGPEDASLNEKIDDVARSIDALGERLRSIEARLDRREPPTPS
ncbi:MAG: potassium channel family protein [Miltoncostaeaceae bacterium]